MKSDVSQTGLSHHLLYSFDILCIQIYLWHHLLVPTDILLEWIVDEIGGVPPIFHHGAMIDAFPQRLCELSSCHASSVL